VFQSAVAKAFRRNGEVDRESMLRSRGFCPRIGGSRSGRLGPRINGIFVGAPCRSFPPGPLPSRAGRQRQDDDRALERRWLAPVARLMAAEERGF
jgi:hypothetical protein